MGRRPYACTRRLAHNGRGRNGQPISGSTMFVRTRGTHRTATPLTWLALTTSDEYNPLFRGHGLCRLCVGGWSNYGKVV